MKIKVIKFGGSSIKPQGETILDAFSFVGNRILKEVENGFRLVVVLSGHVRATDVLISQAEQLTRVPDPKSLDMLLATGEQATVALMSIYLRSKKCDCDCLTVMQTGITTNDTPSSAAVAHINAEALKERLANKHVLLVPGFQGVDHHGNITTLGRGGSDITAISLAIALQADFCEIRTNVDGLYTSIPGKVKGVKPIQKISYDELLEVCVSGSKHPNYRSVKLAKQYTLHFSILHFSGEGNETQISTDSDANLKVLVPNESSLLLSIYGIENIPGASSRLMTFLSKRNIRVLSIYQTFSRRHKADLSVILLESRQQYIKRELHDLRQVLNYGTLKLSDKVGILSIVDKEMKDKNAYMLKLSKLLGDGGININGIFTSDIRISLAMRKDSLYKATQILHDHLF